MDPTLNKQHLLIPPNSPFSSSSRKIKPASRSPKKNLRSSHRRATTVPPVKHSDSVSADPSLVDIHLQTKSMTVSDDSAPSNLKPISALLKSLHVESLPQPGSPRVADIKEMSKTGFSGRGAAQKVLDEKRLVLVGGGRRSFSGSDVEVGCLFARFGARIVAKDMPPFMQIHAVTCARKTYDGLEKFSSKTLAFTLKKEFDKVYGPAWHCIVGSSFGSFVTHSVGGFLYFSLEKVHILLFKTAMQRSD
ncbi:hypothetical protein H6P81_009570 [Aristolochia fimbriata]|uniref:Dynein light chain n=1 Tax=Aristolochia fimbriata TaxID=158543 RepID=A0AAV7ENB2_ARIFI|nr:hypothetical protein H6P81_009570 [Aristolochia fimbriata]